MVPTVRQTDVHGRTRPRATDVFHTNFPHPGLSTRDGETTPLRVPAPLASPCETSKYVSRASLRRPRRKRTHLGAVPGGACGSRADAMGGLWGEGGSSTLGLKGGFWGPERERRGQGRCPSCGPPGSPPDAMLRASLETPGLVNMPPPLAKAPQRASWSGDPVTPARLSCSAPRGDAGCPGSDGRRAAQEDFSLSGMMMLASWGMKGTGTHTRCPQTCHRDARGRLAVFLPVMPQEHSHHLSRFQVQDLQSPFSLWMSHAVC